MSSLKHRVIESVVLKGKSRARKSTRWEERGSATARQGRGQSGAPSQSSPLPECRPKLWNCSSAPRRPSTLLSSSTAVIYPILFDILHLSSIFLISSSFLDSSTTKQRQLQSKSTGRRAGTYTGQTLDLRSTSQLHINRKTGFSRYNSSFALLAHD